MKLIEGKTEFGLTGRSAVAIGKFDGIHKGHQKLIAEILYCRREGLRSVVFTFDRSFASLLGQNPQKDLTTKEEKRRLFAACGIDVLIEFPLTPETAATSPEQFIKDILVGNIHAAKIVAGNDISYGYQGKGDSALLEKMGKQNGYALSIVEKVCYKDKEISSSYIREAVEQGDMPLAQKLLGYPYSIMGHVSYGSQIGRSLGMPTANLIPETDKLLPPNGVYRSEVLFEGKMLKGITNVGSKPTVTHRGQVLAETYLYDFQENIYGKEITVRLLEFQRPEMKFNSLEDLKTQMMKDIAFH